MATNNLSTAANAQTKEPENAEMADEAAHLKAMSFAGPSNDASQGHHDQTHQLAARLAGLKLQQVVAYTESEQEAEARAARRLQQWKDWLNAHDMGRRDGESESAWVHWITANMARMDREDEEAARKEEEAERRAWTSRYARLAWLGLQVHEERDGGKRARILAWINNVPGGMSEKVNEVIEADHGGS